VGSGSDEWGIVRCVKFLVGVVLFWGECGCEIGGEGLWCFPLVWVVSWGGWVKCLVWREGDDFVNVVREAEWWGIGWDGGRSGFRGRFVLEVLVVCFWKILFSC